MDRFNFNMYQFVFKIYHFLHSDDNFLLASYLRILSFSGVAKQLSSQAKAQFAKRNGTAPLKLARGVPETWRVVLRAFKG